MSSGKNNYIASNEKWIQSDEDNESNEDKGKWDISGIQR